MKKICHKILSFLLAAAIAGSVWPAGVFAAFAPKEAQASVEAAAQTSLPESTAVPTATQAPESTAVPAATQAPESTAAPAATQAPESTAAPTATQAPESTAAPAATQAPESTAAPTATQAPESTAAPTATPAPENPSVPMEDSPEEMENDPNIQSDPDPEPLNLEMLVEEQGFAAFRGAMLLTSGLSGSTIVQGEDNEDNAHSGRKDGDMDVLLGLTSTMHPIEVRLDITEAQLPRESAVLAIKAYDVDEEFGEKDIVYFNGVAIGRLSGTNGTWNTTILTVPKNLVKSGANYLEIEVSRGWVVRIDWVQLLLDGGEKSGEVESFELTLGQASEGGSNTVLLPVTVSIQATGGKTYDTEFALLDGVGNSVAAAFGTATGSEQTTVQMNVPTEEMETGTYRVVGLLKDPENEAVLAQDTVDWYYDRENPTLMAPVLKASVTPSGTAAREAEVTITALPVEGMTIQSVTAVEIEDQPTGVDSLTFKTAENIASTGVRVVYTLNGQPKEATIPARLDVDNIDRVSPEIAFNNQVITVDADTGDEDVRRLVLEQAAVTDAVSPGGSGWYAGVAGVSCELEAENIAAKGGYVTVVAVDHAGNKASENVFVQPIVPPLQLGRPTAARVGTTSEFTLSAELISTGGRVAEATGFVWGAMQNPTLSLNNGNSVSSPAVGEGQNITADATVADGVNYYARAYVTIGGVTYYSQQVSFSINAKNYGTVSIRNNGNNTFTVSRTGADGEQTVYYRTVNGSAVGDTHFTHQAGRVTIPEGQTTATITIAETGANVAYSGYPATAYSNADRTYQVEIYKVEGGASIGSEKFATRTLPTAKTVAGSLFEEYSVDIPGKGRGDYDDDGRGWSNGDKIGTTAVETVEVRPENQDYWTRTAQSVRYYLTFEAQEVNQGHQVLQMLPGNTLDTSIYPKNDAIIGIDNINSSRVYYVAMFEHGNKPLAADKDWESYQFPGPVDFPSQSKMTHSKYRDGQSGSYISFPPDTTFITTGFGGSGADGDKWNTRNAKHHIQVYDDREPQLAAVAPMAASTYKPGDTVTVSLVFDEIVDGAKSTLNDVVIETSWGVFKYAGGANTNVLYFTGTVPESGSGRDLTVNRILNAGYIRDMCDPSATSTSGNANGDTGADADFTVPAITVSGEAVSGGTASAKVTVTNADSMQYVWKQSEAMPVSGWQDFVSGATLATRQKPGESWHLHILAEYTSTGAAAHRSVKFTFPSEPEAALPELEASVDNTGWARARTIRLTIRPAGAKVSMTGPDGSTQTVTGDVTATQNGWYSFTLTSGGETLTRAVEVKNIDRDAPVAEEMRTPGLAATAAPGLSFSAVISDALSGLKTVEYRFSESDAAPAEGWQTASPEGGRYFFEYTASSPEKKTVYLHLRATDHAGNVWQYASRGYGVQQPATGALTVSLSDPSGAWTADKVNIVWTLGGVTTDTPFTLYGVSDGGAQTGAATFGSFEAAQNGLYTVMAVDSRGRTGQSSVLVNRIDANGPFVSKVEVSPGWTSGDKTVALAGLSDDSTPQYDEHGNITGYSGVGVASARYKMAGAGDETLKNITGDSFTVSENGSYTLVLTDWLGNRTTRLFTVAGIDKEPPEAELSEIPASWQKTPVNVTLTFSDGASGVEKVQTAFVADNFAAPAEESLQVQDASAGSVTLTAQQGAQYLYYRITDRAGNVIDGFSDLIRVDKTVPDLTVIQTEQQGKAVLRVSADGGPSGAQVFYSPDNISYKPLTEETFTSTASGSCFFKAITGAQAESAVETVTLHKVKFDTPGGVAAPTFQLIREGGRVQSPADPARTGYGFAGWRKAGAAYAFETPVSGSFTLAAAWTLNEPAVDVTAAYGGQSEGTFTYNGGDLVFAARAVHVAQGVSYTYQWLDGEGNAIPGATGETFAVSAASAGEHRYSCAVTATDGSGLSADAKGEKAAVIAKAPVDFAVTENVHDYDSTEKSAVVDPRTEVDGLTVSAADYAVHCERDGQTVTPVTAGEYDVAVVLKSDSLKFAGEADSLREKKVGSLVIRSAPYPNADTMAWPGAAPLTYGQTLAESALTGEGLETAGSYAWKTPGLIPTVENRGCTVVFTPNDPNYEPVERTVAVEVAPRELTVSGVSAVSRAYDPASTAVALTGGSLVGVISRDGTPDKVELDGSQARGSLAAPDAGQDLPVRVSGYALTGADASNYTLRQPDAVTVTIRPAEGRATLAMESWTYGETPGRPEAASPTNGTDSVAYRYTGTLANGETYDSATPPADAGRYRVQAVFAATGNYQAVTEQAEFTVEQRPLSLTWNRLDVVYSGAAQAPEIAGLVGVLPADAEGVGAEVTGPAGPAAGTCSVSARLTGERAFNYAIQNPAASFTIRPAPVVFRVEDNSVLYDGGSHAARVTAQALGQPFEAFTVSYQTMEGEAVAAPVEPGRYRVLAAIDDANYRHSAGADNAARQVGVLEIYTASASAVWQAAFLPGAEDVSGTPPSLPDSIAGSIHILPGPGSLQREGYRFAGWQYAGRTYPAGSAFVMPGEDVAFTALWEEATYEIGGSVVWDDETDPRPVEQVLVTLTRGSEEIAQTRTGADGGFSFRQVSAGLYNLVASHGGVVQTQKILLTDRDQDKCVIRLPRGNTNSVLKVLDGTPAVVVGNLDKMFGPQPDRVYTQADRELVENGGTVEIRMTVAGASPAPGSPLDNAINGLSGGFRQGLTLEVSMDKSRLKADGTLLDAGALTECEQLVEIVVPLDGDLQNRRGYRVLREHGGAVDEIGSEPNSMGEYFVLNESRTQLTVFAKRFSLYSVLCSDTRPDGGGETPQEQPEAPAPTAAPPAPSPAAPAAPAAKEEEPAATPAATPKTAAPTPAPQTEKEPQENSGGSTSGPAASVSGGKPFVLLNAAAALAGILLAVFGKSRGKARLLCAACAAGAAAVTLLTTGWNGLAAVDVWTLPVAALALLAARLSRRGPDTTGEDAP